MADGKYTKAKDMTNLETDKLNQFFKDAKPITNTSFDSLLDLVRTFAANPTTGNQHTLIEQAEVIAKEKADCDIEVMKQFGAQMSSENSIKGLHWWEYHFISKRVKGWIGVLWDRKNGGSNIFGDKNVVTGKCPCNDYQSYGSTINDLTLIAPKMPMDSCVNCFKPKPIDEAEFRAVMERVHKIRLQGEANLKREASEKADGNRRSV